jgi:acyl dehydratase
MGTDLGVSEPQRIDQDMVDTHAATTGDAQWIHNDPVRAAAEGPFGGPIVQGFLLLSLLTRHSASLRLPAAGPVSMMVNYGFDRVRFVAPVPVGSAVRARATLAEVRVRDDRQAVLGLDVVLEQLADDGSATAAVVARWLFLAVR